MLIVDGMPGAGKTTLLTRLKRYLRDDMLLLEPPSVPVGVHDESAVAVRLLNAVRARVDQGERFEAADTKRFAAADHGQVCVLGYRYALWRINRGPRRDFDAALRECDRLRLFGGEHTTLILRSSRRMLQTRLAYTRKSDGRPWDEPDFLEAYDHFLQELGTWTETGPRTILVDAHSEAWTNFVAWPHDAIADTLREGQRIQGLLSA